MIYLSAFLVPIVLYVITMIMTGLYPFGDNALLVSDINNQMVAFFTYYKHVLTSNDNLIYSFSKTLGGNMEGFSGYYLRNPFLLFVLFFDDSHIPVAIVFILAVSLACMGLTMMIYLTSYAKYNSVEMTPIHKAGILAFSTSYAFMGYVFAYIPLIMYFGCFVLFPIVMLGVEQLIRKKKCIVYIIALALSIISNYYIGYMICLFSIIYFVIRSVVINKHKDLSNYIRFLLASIVAAGLSAFSLIPTILSLRGGEKQMPTREMLSLYPEYSLEQLVCNLLPNAFNGGLTNSSAPYVYIGITLLIMLFVFFYSRRISTKSKITSLIMIAIIVLSSLISTLNLIWHGFNKPVGFAHRFAFIISFVLIITAYEGYLSLNNCRFIMPIVGLLMIAEFSELTVNAAHSINVQESNSLKEYVAYYDRTNEAISSIKEKDETFYRIEKDYEWSHNDAMMFAYNGLSHNSSCDLSSVKEFMAKMGYRYFYPIWSYYNQGSTKFADCFLGVKYFISRFDETNKPYEFEYSIAGKNGNGEEKMEYVFSNPYALPLALGMDDIQMAANINQENLFLVQNEIAGTEIFTKADISDISNYYKFELDEMTESIYNTGDFDGKNTVNMTEPGIEDATASISSLYLEDEISIDIEATKDCNLYFYATAPDYQEAKIYINGNFSCDYFNNSVWNIVGIGRYDKGDEVNIRIEATGSPIMINNLYVYEEDVSAISDWYDRTIENTVNLNKISSSIIEGTISNSNSDAIVFTIPYEKAWKVEIDGKRVETECVYDCLLAIRPGKGEHTVRMKYVPDGKYAGLIISLISVFVLGYYVYDISVKSHLPHHACM